MQYVNQLVEDVKNDGWYIAHIDNPPLAVQLAAVQHTVCSVGLIDHPDVAVRRYVIRKSDLAYSMLKNPTELDLAFHQMTWEL